MEEFEKLNDKMDLILEYVEGALSELELAQKAVSPLAREEGIRNAEMLLRNALHLEKR